MGRSSRVETLSQRPTWLGSSHQWPWWHSPPQLLSSRETPAMPSSCRSRDLTLVLESLEQHTHRRTELFSERSRPATMRGSASTATLTTRARRSLKYSAGINGFRILEGDHIPSGGQNSALAATNVAGEPEEYDYEYYDDRQPQSVFVNPHDSSHHTKHLLDGNLAGHLAGRVFTTPRPGLLQPVEPRRKSFPPGQIQLDRFPEGFNFNFQSQQG